MGFGEIRMTIFIVQRNEWNGEYFFNYNVRAFRFEQDAELFILECKDEWKKYVDSGELWYSPFYKDDRMKNIAFLTRDPESRNYYKYDIDYSIEELELE
jgi:hypothetical protein